MSATRVRHQQRIAWIGDQRRKPVGDAELLFHRREQHHAAIGGDASTVECRGVFLAAAGKLNGNRGIVTLTSIR